MRLLFTGFEPFGGETVNPAWEAVRRLPDRLGGAELFKAEIPVSFARAGICLAEEIKRTEPDAVICVGQAGGRSRISVERVALNLQDAAIPDNDGARPEDRPVRPGGPAAYFSTLPVRRIAAALTDAGIPAELSCTAGTFVCNSLMYTLLDMCASEGGRTLGGFIHVPYSTEQAEGKAPGTPCMEPDTIKRAIEIVAAAVSGYLEERLAGA